MVVNQLKALPLQHSVTDNLKMVAIAQLESCNMRNVINIDLRVCRLSFTYSYAISYSLAHETKEFDYIRVRVIKSITQYDNLHILILVKEAKRATVLNFIDSHIIFVG